MIYKVKKIHSHLCKRARLACHNWSMYWLIFTQPYAANEEDLALLHFTMLHVCTSHVVWIINTPLCITCRLNSHSMQNPTKFNPITKEKIQHFLTSCFKVKNCTEGTVWQPASIPKHRNWMPICSSFTGTPVLQRQTEGTGTVQPGEEKVLGKPHHTIPGPKKVLKESWRGTFSKGLGITALNLCRVDVD